MTGSELKAIRKALRARPVQFARALGYGGTDASVRASLARLEAPNSKRFERIPETKAKLARMFLVQGWPFRGE